MDKIELIDRVKVAESVAGLAIPMEPDDDNDRIFLIGYNQAVRHAKHLIRIAPTIDAAPVRRSEWIVCQDVDGNEYGKCSYCGGETYDGDNDTFDQPPNFCQHCGADMRMEERHVPED